MPVLSAGTLLSRAITSQPVTPSLAALLAADEADALALDFTDDFWYATTGQYGSAYIVDTGTPANDLDGIPYDLLTYTSPSVKMCRQSDGTLKYGAHNFCLQSSSFTTTWADASSGATMTLQPSELDPLGATGTVYELDVSLADSLIRQDVTFPALVGYSVAVYVKQAASGSATHFRLTTNDAVGWDTGVSTKVALTSSWQLVSGVATQTSSTTVRIHLGTKDVSGTNDADCQGKVLVAFAHLRRTPSIDTYLATTTAAKYELPYEWDAAGDPLGIRVEEARTNLLTYSNDFSNAAWTLQTITAAQNVTGPGGVSNSAWTMTEGATSAQYSTYQAGPGNASYATSVFLKQGGRRYVNVSRGGNLAAQFDLQTGVVSDTFGSVTATIEAYNNGWYRCTVSKDSANLDYFVISAAIGAALATTVLGDAYCRETISGLSGVSYYMAFAQVEAGSYPTSYIPVPAGTTVTRDADSGITIATSAYPHSATVNSAMIRYRPLNVAAAMVALRWDDGTSNEVVSVGHSAAAALGLTVTDGGAAQTAPLTDGTAAAATWEKVAVSWKANDFLFSDNGAAAVADTSGTLPTVTSLDIGPTLSGHISQILVVPVEKTAAEVATMATP